MKMIRIILLSNCHRQSTN